MVQYIKAQVYRKQNQSIVIVCLLILDKSMIFLFAANSSSSNDDAILNKNMEYIIKSLSLIIILDYNIETVFVFKSCWLKYYEGDLRECYFIFHCIK